MRIISRTTNLVRGLLSRWIGRREHRHPEAVYEAAIHERLAQYDKLRQATAGILYLRGKLGKELERHGDELVHLRRQLEIAVDRDDDTAALALIARRDGLATEANRLTAELTELTREADGAKQNLVTFQAEIAGLREERVRMMARLASAKARLRFQSTLGGFSTAADIHALEEVRDYINRVVAETQITREIGDGELERRLDHIREAEADSSARAQLEELKRSRRNEKLVPMVLPVPAVDGVPVVRRVDGHAG